MVWSDHLYNIHHESVPMTFQFNNGFVRAKPIKPSFNVRAGMDIPSGIFVEGPHGETILLGGVSYVNAIIGQGNCFKSRIQRYWIAQILKLYPQACGMVFDTENLISEVHVREEYRWLKLDPDVVFSDENPRLVITRSADCDGTEWYDMYRQNVERKVKEAKLVSSPFLDRDGKTSLKFYIPDPVGIDTVTEFKDTKTIEMGGKSLGDSKAQMIHMKSGAAKSRMLSELSNHCIRGDTPMFLVAQVGKKFEMDLYAPPEQKLQYLKHLEIKGGGTKMIYAPELMYFVQNVSVLDDGSSEKFVKYPREGFELVPRDTDLNNVNLQILRNKYGPSGRIINVIVSQNQGVLPALSEFAMLADAKRWGLPGNDRFYSSPFVPGVTLSRTKIRTLLETNARLDRAMMFSSQMLQMFRLYGNLRADLRMPVEVVAESLLKQGYRLEELMETRGEWCYDNDKHPVPYLSTMDLLLMAKGEKKPHWMKKSPTDRTIAVGGLDKGAKKVIEDAMVMSIDMSQAQYGEDLVANPFEAPSLEELVSSGAMELDTENPTVA